MQKNNKIRLKITFFTTKPRIDCQTLPNYVKNHKKSLNNCKWSVGNAWGCHSEIKWKNEDGENGVWILRFFFY